MRPKVLVTAPVATRSGYGARSRDVVSALLALDKFDVKVFAVPWGSTPQNALVLDDPRDKAIYDIIVKDQNELKTQPDIHIHIVVPNEFNPIGKLNIGITAGIETTGCVPEWIQGLNKMDMVIVPSKFSKDIFMKTVFESQNDKTGQKGPDLKVEKPIEVLFEGADLNIYKSTDSFSKSLVEEFDKVEEKFNFLYTGHWLQGNLGHDRKDTGMLVKTFLETFKNVKDAPGLIMKTSGATFSIIDREEIISKIKDIKSTVQGELPNVYLFHGDFSDEEMNGLYNHPKVKAHVSLTHGEGFGRPLLEASLSEKPVIAPNWSGHTDFLKKPNAVLIGGSISDVPKGSFPENFHVDSMKWFTVNYQEASTILKDIHKNYRKYTLNAKKITAYNRVKFSLKEMTRQFGVILDKYVPDFPSEVKLNLPKLKKVGSNEVPKIKLPKLKKV